MRILKLELRNWRNFKSVNVPLRRRVFLAGPNASGKSNFLDAFRFLKDVATVGGGLGKAVETRGGVSRLRSLYARRYPNVTIAIELGDDPQAPEWSYHLEFNQNNNRQPIVKKEIVKNHGGIVLDRKVEKEADDPELQTQTDLEQVRANGKFRSIPEFLRTIQYLHIVPQLVREPGRYVGKVQDPFGSDFLEKLAKFQKDHEGNFEKRLHKINEALKVAVPQLTGLNLGKDYNGIPHLSGLFEHWRPGAGWQQENDFSDGTLRLFGLLWAILDTQGLLLLEEPELSLHPAIVRHIPQMFARIITKKKQNVQIIVSTHSVDIFSDSGIDPGEVLLLRPTKEGSFVGLVSQEKDVKKILECGLELSDIIVSQTAPKDARKLSEFGES